MKSIIDSNRMRYFVFLSCTIHVIAQAPPAHAKNPFDFLFGKHKVKATQDAAIPSKKDSIISSEILINAPAKIVWETVHLERDCAPNLVSNNLLRSDQNHSVFEQKWQLVPFLAKTTCVMDEQDVPYEHIDFKLLNSDVFSSMYGAWKFTPENDGKLTRLALDLHFQARGIAPKSFVTVFAKRKIAQRLEHIKEMAELSRTQLEVDATVIK